MLYQPLERMSAVLHEIENQGFWSPTHRGAAFSVQQFISDEGSTEYYTVADVPRFKSWWLKLHTCKPAEHAGAQDPMGSLFLLMIGLIRADTNMEWSTEEALTQLENLVGIEHDHDTKLLHWKNIPVGDFKGVKH